MSRNPGRLAWPVLVMFVGVAMALPSAGSHWARASPTWSSLSPGWFSPPGSWSS
jgi:hypothetical protein